MDWKWSNQSTESRNRIAGVYALLVQSPTPVLDVAKPAGQRHSPSPTGVRLDIRRMVTVGSGQRQCKLWLSGSDGPLTKMCRCGSFNVMCRLGAGYSLGPSVNRGVLNMSNFFQNLSKLWGDLNFV
jgi:hypothetical protein